MMKTYIRKLLREGLFDSIPEEDFIRAYSNKINEKYDSLLIKGAKNQNYKFILGNKIKKVNFGDPNKCETNTFNFIKQRLAEGEDYFYPVGGFGFEGPSLFPIEHWWVYNKRSNEFWEVSPLHGEGFRCYAGVTNFEINNEIREAKYFHDIFFFKGGNVQHTYFK